MKKYVFSVLFLASLPITASAQVNGTRRGTVLGGLVGAAAGAAIGEHNDKPLAGALIGGAVGAIAGRRVGNARDQQIARQRAYQQYQQQQYRQQQQVVQRAVTPATVVSMTQSGLSETVIINHIQSNGLLQQLQVSDIVALHQNGVSDRVITAMQRAHLTSAGPIVGQTSLPVVVRSPTVIQAHPVYPTPPVVIQRYTTPRYQTRYPVSQRYPTYSHGRSGSRGHDSSHGRSLYRR